MRPQLFQQAALAALTLLGGCSGRESAQDSGSGGHEKGALVGVSLTFTRDARGTRFSAQGHFARFRPGEQARAATLLGLPADDLALDTCRLVDAHEELDRAFRSGDAGGIALLDAG